MTPVDEFVMTNNPAIISTNIGRIGLFVNMNSNLNNEDIIYKLL